MNATPRTVAILVFDDVEVLDFAGPLEVFGVADELAGGESFNVVTVAPAPGTILARQRLKLNPTYTLENCPAADLLVIPGGLGTRALLRRPAVLEWVRQRARHAEIVFSICTGALVLGQIGLLDGLRVTTHADSLALLAEIAPAAVIDPSRRYHDHGKIVTAAGISAGIDAALHLVGRLLGSEAAARTAREMEYGTYAQPSP